MNKAFRKLRFLRLCRLRSLLTALLFAFPLLIPCTAAEKSTRPNILFIMADDLCADLGCYGAPVKSPNIDKLAASGVRFDRAYCQYPLCNPSRSSLLTGLRPSTTGIYALQPGIRAVAALKDHVTLPQYFAVHGYSTFTAGKVKRHALLEATQADAFQGFRDAVTHFIAAEAEVQGAEGDVGHWCDPTERSVE